MHFTRLDSSGGQLSKDSTVADLGTLSFDRINPVTGPIHIDGAEPGDVVKVTIEAFEPSGWGWTANIPGFGLLADQFPDPALHVRPTTPTAWGPRPTGDGEVPLKPFAGTIGLAPAEPGLHSVVPPRRMGGNMDIRDTSAGTGSTCRSRWRAGCSRWATPTRRRATARFAARRSRAR
ncbi:MAG: acetamidase/formamidase family protein [Paracoccaceae bacterium]